MKPEFHPAAEREFAASAMWYESRVPGLGAQMRDDVRRAVDTLSARPLVGRRLSDDLRSYPLRRFPYKLIYRVSGDNLRIIAVAHDRRWPGFWSERR